RPSDRTVGVAGYAGPRRGAPAGPVASGTYQLLALTGPAIGVVFALSEGRTRWTIGRAKDRDVPLELDPFVSGAHAEIQLAAPGPELVDVFSSNGTHLNFAKIPRGGRVPLRVGDVVNVGRTHLVLQLG
ncbi:MAG: FHA domain-containing protein, partial [Methanobacteriota archaeon]